MNDVFLAYLRGIRGEEVGDELERAVKAATRLGDREMAIQGRWFLARLSQQRHDPAGDRLLRAAEAEARAAGLQGLARQIAQGV
jgi:hypothetical protein